MATVTPFEQRQNNPHVVSGIATIDINETATLAIPCGGRSVVRLGLPTLTGATLSFTVQPFPPADPATPTADPPFRTLLDRDGNTVTVTVSGTGVVEVPQLSGCYAFTIVSGSAEAAAREIEVQCVGANPVPFDEVPSDALRHVRKTLTFDGTAGKGQSGSPISLFTLTGRVILERGTAYLTAGVSAGGGTLALGPTADTTAIMRAIPVDGATGFAYYVVATSGSGWRENWSDLIASKGGGSTFENTNYMQNLTISQSIRGTVATADITGGTIVIDLWYRPITDDGRLVAA